MRNLKKLFAVVVVIAVMLTTMIPAAFAEDATLSADAKICADLGILTGDTGVTAAYTATQPARIQALVMILRLKGVLADAQKATGDNFSDVKAAWEKPLTAYAKAHPELGFVGSNNKFDPDSKIDAKQYYSVMLTALGYSGDYTWSTVLAKAASVGLTKNLDNTKFTVNDLAVATVEALKAKVKGSDKTLAATLAAVNSDFAKKAETAGLYTPVAPVFTVAKVEALNLNQIKVTFTDPVDKGTAESTANYTLDNGNGISAALNAWNTPAVNAPAASLQSDNKSVIITLDTDNNNTSNSMLVNQIKATIGVANVLSADKSKTMTSYTGSFTYVDTVAPTAVSATVLGNKVLQVKFSEDVHGSTTTTAYKLDGASLATYSLSSVSYDSASATVTMNFANALPTTAKKLTVSQDNSIVDLAGLRLISQDVAVNVGSDTTAGTIKAVNVDGGKGFVDVVFSKPLAFVSDIAGNPITIDGNASVMTDATIAKSIVNGNLRLQTAGAGTGYAAIITGGAHAVNIKNDGSNSITDAFGVKVAASSITYTLTQDSTKPTVASVAQTEAAKVEVKFSEGVDAVTGLNALNYTIKDANGNGVTITGAAFKTGTTDTVQLSLSGALASGSSSITVAAVKDTSANTMDTYTGTFTAVDKTGPTVASMSFSGQNLIITFNESVDPIVATNAANYLFKNGALPSGTSLSMVSSSQVKVAFPLTTAIANGDNFAVKSDLCDLAGNKMAGFGYSAAITVLTNDLARVAYSGTDYVHLTDAKTVEFKLNKELTNLDITDFEYSLNNGGAWTTFGAGGALAATASFTNGSSSSTVKIVFAADAFNTNGTAKAGGLAVQIRVRAAGGVAYGTQAADSTKFAGTTAIGTGADKIAPALISSNPITTIDADGNGKIDHIAVEFTENMDTTFFSNSSFTVAGYSVTSVATNSAAVTTATQAGDGVADPTVLIRVTEGSFDTAATPAVTFVGTMKDTAGNAYTIPTSAQVAVDAAAPIIVSMTENATSTSLTVTFSEAVTGATTAANWTPTIASGATIGTVTASGSVVTVPLTGGAIVAADTLQATANIKDVAGTAVLAAKDLGTRGAGAAGAGAYTIN